MIINADVGEMLLATDVDLALVNCVDAVNIALGGHAGEAEWSRELAKRAERAGCAVHLHPSYPDREGFGRQDLDLPWADLHRSLSEQRAVLPEVELCKFHGALYNLAAVDMGMACLLANWCRGEGIRGILAPPESAMERAALSAGLEVLREGFVDRAYERSVWGEPVLVSRKKKGALLSIEDAMAQAKKIALSGHVPLLEGGQAALPCDTLCLHGDGPGALELASQLREYFHD